jgi:hypothetical protein
VKAAILVTFALVAQVALGLPESPTWLTAILLPMVFVVGPPLLMADRRWPHSALLLGLAWDLVLEPVVGPGAIAWSASAVAVGFVVPLVADRSPRAWIAFGALGAGLMIVVRHVALMPLGLAAELTGSYVLLSVVLTSLWCGLVGWMIALDLPTRWITHRARKLR